MAHRAPPRVRTHTGPQRGRRLPAGHGPPCGRGWYWHLLEAELRRRGHDVVAPDLPSEDDSAGLPEYADTVVDAIGDRADLVVVAQSFGGFTAPLVCDRLPVDLLVLVAGMVPRPGEPPGDWWARHRLPAGTARARRARRRAAGGRHRPVPARRPAGPGRRGATAGTGPVRHPHGAALAPGGVAEGAHQVPGLPRRPLLPRRLPPPGGAGPAEHHRRRDGRQPLRRPQPPHGAGRPLEAYRAELDQKSSGRKKPTGTGVSATLPGCAPVMSGVVDLTDPSGPPAAEPMA